MNRRTPKSVTNLMMLKSSPNKNFKVTDVKLFNEMSENFIAVNFDGVWARLITIMMAFLNLRLSLFSHLQL